MKLLLFVCLCALAAATPEEKAPTTGPLTLGVTNLCHEFLQKVSPKTLKIQDALDIKWRNSMMSSVSYRSQMTAVFDGEDEQYPTFSYIHNLITPGQKGFCGKWSKYETANMVVTYHYGGAVKIHMLTEDGTTHKEAIIGNPAFYHGKSDAKVVVVIPKNTYYLFESLSEDESTFNSLMAIPAFNPEHYRRFSQQEMATKYPVHLALFTELSKPGVHHDDDHDDHRRNGGKH